MSWICFAPRALKRKYEPKIEMSSSKETMYREGKKKKASQILIPSKMLCSAADEVLDTRQKKWREADLAQLPRAFHLSSRQFVHGVGS
jgi:hypothetical protein